MINVNSNEPYINKLLSLNEREKNILNESCFFLMTLEDDNGQNKQIKIYKDSDPFELAFNFCKINNLDASSMKYIKTNIKQIKNQFNTAQCCKKEDTQKSNTEVLTQKNTNIISHSNVPKRSHNNFIKMYPTSPKLPVINEESKNSIKLKNDKNITKKKSKKSRENEPFGEFYINDNGEKICQINFNNNENNNIKKSLEVMNGINGNAKKAMVSNSIDLEINNPRKKNNVMKNVFISSPICNSNTKSIDINLMNNSANNKKKIKERSEIFILQNEGNLKENNSMNKIKKKFHKKSDSINQNFHQIKTRKSFNQDKSKYFHINLSKTVKINKDYNTKNLNNSNNLASKYSKNNLQNKNIANDSKYHLFRKNYLFSKLYSYRKDIQKLNPNLYNLIDSFCNNSEYSNNSPKTKKTIKQLAKNSNSSMNVRINTVNNIHSNNFSTNHIHQKAVKSEIFLHKVDQNFWNKLYKNELSPRNCLNNSKSKEKSEQNLCINLNNFNSNTSDQFIRSSKIKNIKRKVEQSKRNSVEKNHSKFKNTDFSNSSKHKFVSNISNYELKDLIFDTAGHTTYNNKIPNMKLENFKKIQNNYIKQKTTKARKTIDKIKTSKNFIIKNNSNILQKTVASSTEEPINEKKKLLKLIDGDIIFKIKDRFERNDNIMKKKIILDNNKNKNFSHRQNLSYDFNYDGNKLAKIMKNNEKKNFGHNYYKLQKSSFASNNIIQKIFKMLDTDNDGVINMNRNIIDKYLETFPSEMKIVFRDIIDLLFEANSKNYNTKNAEKILSMDKNTFCNYIFVLMNLLSYE